MSCTGRVVFELQENDDSFDGEGWPGEVVLKEKLLPSDKKSEQHKKFEKGFSATHKADSLI